mgnify:CR=1 FL=1
MSWEKVALSEVADFSNGVNFDKSAYSSGVKLIGVSNFGDRFHLIMMNCKRLMQRLSDRATIL